MKYFAKHDISSFSRTLKEPESNVSKRFITTIKSLLKKLNHPSETTLSGQRDLAKYILKDKAYSKTHIFIFFSIINTTA